MKYDYLKNLPFDEKRSVLEMLSEDIIQKETEELPVNLIKIDEKQKEALNILQNSNKLVGFGTGITKLDKIMGGMDKEELIIIGGQTGHGKSLLMQKIALNVADEAPILYMSLEMSVPQQIARFYLMGKGMWQTPVESISKLPIYFYNGKDAITLKTLGKALESAVRDFGVKMCFIDHLHYLSHSIDNMNNEIGNIVRTVKGYARKYEMPIAMISTLRKLDGNKKPDIDDLKDSTMIGYDADSIIMVWRDMEGTERPANILSVKVRKNRPRGRLGTIQLEITDNYNLMELTDKQYD